MQRCWVKDPKARPTAEEVLQDLESMVNDERGTGKARAGTVVNGIATPKLESLASSGDDPHYGRGGGLVFCLIKSWLKNLKL